MGKEHLEISVYTYKTRPSEVTKTRNDAVNRLGSGILNASLNCEMCFMIPSRFRAQTTTDSLSPRVPRQRKTPREAPSPDSRVID